MRTWRMLAVVLVMLSAVPAVAVDDGCGDPLRAPRFGEAATADSMRGVVEFESIASNPLPWGRSVAAVTRVWGGVSVERLEISRRRFVSCPQPAFLQAGSVRYRFVGLDIDGVDDELVLEERADVQMVATLDLELGSPVVFAISGFDRVMASLQAWLWEFVAGVLVLAATGTVVAGSRRRGRERRGYLF